MDKLDKRAEIACSWINRAKRDLEAAGILHREGLHGESTFHAQQAAEKALKALIRGLGVQPPETHQIEMLLIILQKNGKRADPVRH